MLVVPTQMILIHVLRNKKVLKSYVDAMKLPTLGVSSTEIRHQIWTYFIIFAFLNDKYLIYFLTLLN